MPQQLREWFLQHGASRGSVRCTYVIRTGDRAGQTCGKVGHTHSRCFSRLDDAWRAEFGDEAELPRWLELLRNDVDEFSLDYDANLVAMYGLTVSVEGDCFLCVPPDPGIEAAALGAIESALSGTAPVAALHTFTLNSGASRCIFRDSTTVTPLTVPVAISLPDPSGGPVFACSSTVLSCLAVLSGSLSVFHLPSFSTNLVSTAALQDAMVTTTTPGGQRVTISTFGQASASSQVAAPYSCCLLSHQTLLWHHLLGHPSLPRLHGMHSRLLVSGLPRSLPPLPPSPAPPCLPCVEWRQRAALHSSSFPPTTAPLHTLHMDSRYTTFFRLRNKGEVPDVLIPWIRAIYLKLRERFRQDLPVLHLHSDRGVRCASTQPLAPCLLVGDLAYTALDGKVSDVSVFRVWDSRAFVRDTSVDKLSSRAIPCVFLGFPPDAPGRQFYHPTSHCVLPSQEVTFDESVPFYHLFPYRTAPLPTALPRSRSSSDSGAAEGGAARGVASGGAKPASAEPGGAEPESAELGGAEPEDAESRGAEPESAEPGGAEANGAESGGAEPEGTVSGGAEPRGTASAGGPAGASPRQSRQREPLSPQQLRVWFAQRTRLRSGAAGARGHAARGIGARDTGIATPEGAGGSAGGGGAGAGGTKVAGAAGTGGAGGACTGGAGAAEAGGTRAGDPGAGGARAGGARSGGASARGTGAGGAGAGDTGAGGAGTGGAGAGGTCAGGTMQRRPFLVPPPPSSLPLPGSPDSPLPAPPYTEQLDSLIEHREPASHPASPIHTICTGRSVPRLRPPPVPGTHIMAIHPSSLPLRVPLPSPPVSSLAEVPDPGSDLVRAASPTVIRLLATVVTNPSFESTTASALITEIVDFAAACRLNYAASLLPESASDSPPSVGGECALGMDVLEDKQEDLECLAAAVTHLVAMVLAPKGHPVAPDIPTPRSYAEAITGPYSSQWQTAMDTEMASWKSTGTYVDAVPPPGANIVDGIFWVKRPPSSPPAFKRLHSVFQRFGFQYSSTQSTPLPTGHSLSAPPSDESVEPSGPYLELVGSLMYLMTCTRPDLAYPLSILARYVAPGRHRSEHWEAAWRVLRYLCSTLGMGLVHGGRGPVVLTGHADAS
ncbi:unnamed protein product [Closterium sp. NIES-54]